MTETPQQPNSVPRTEPSPSAGASHADDATVEDRFPDADGAPAPDDGAPERTPDEDDSAVLDLQAAADADPRSKGELLGELLEAEAKRDEYLDDLRRSHADFENFRRRMLREGASQRAAGQAELAGTLLEVLDDLDRTIEAAATSEDDGLAKGVELVASKLLGALRAAGLQRIDATAVVFDPTEHDAVQQQPAEAPRDEPIVAAVLRPGYRMADRVLRPAMVVVEQ